MGLEVPKLPTFGPHTKSYEHTELNKRLHK